MSSEALARAIAFARDAFSVTLAQTPESHNVAYRLRYEVYCLERGYHLDSTDIETDEFDDAAQHVLLSHRASGEALGTVRMVMPVADRLSESFPMQAVCAPGLLAHLPLGSTGEISRFAISKTRRQALGPEAALMRLGLIQGLIRITFEEGLTEWCAVMERSLLRMLQSTAIHFQPLGPLVEHHGIRQPATCHVRTMLARMQRDQPLIWGFLTEDGLLCAEPKRTLVVGSGNANGPPHVLQRHPAGAGQARA